jgi:hypothetical protein
MTVTLRYFNGCPNWRVALERIEAAVAVVGTAARIETELVDTVEQALQLDFRGSPSILINGRDPFDSGSASAGLTCRVYDTPDGPQGAPTVAQIAAALRR